MTENQAVFLKIYRDLVIERYEWAKAPSERREKLFLGMTETVTTDRNVVNIDGDCAKDAFRAAGGKGRLTFKALRAL